MHTERYENTFVDRRGRDITVIAWAIGTTKQDALRKAERMFRRIVREQTATSARAASA